jgi:hypothetical protein
LSGGESPRKLSQPFGRTDEGKLPKVRAEFDDSGNQQETERGKSLLYFTRHFLRLIFVLVIASSLYNYMYSQTHANVTSE